MYQYLTKKLEQAPAPVHIKSLSFIAFEVLSQSQSDLFEDFTELENEEICEILSWKNTKEVHSLIEEELALEGSLSGLLFRNSKEGFLSKVHVEIPMPHGKYYSYSEGFCRIKFVYADTIAELVDKIIHVSNAIDVEEKTNLKKQIKEAE